MTGRRYECDAVVVGAGPNGLAAAIGLAERGLEVMVYERGATVGGGTRSAELTEAGFVHDVCSAVHPLLLASPFFRRIGWERLGIEPLHPEVPLAHPTAGDEAALLQRSLEDTAAGLGPDRDAYLDLMGPLLERSDELVPALLSSDRMPAHPLVLARFAAEGIRAATSVARSEFRSEQARSLFAGAAAHSMLPLDSPLTAGVGILLLLLGHAVGWPVIRGGSQRIADGLADHLVSLGGRIVTGAQVESLRELPAARVYLLDVTPRQLLAIAGDELPSRYRLALDRFRYGPGVFKMDWALSEPVPWSAPEAGKAGTLHVGGTLDEINASARAAFEGRHGPNPFVIVAQPTIVDPSRAPEGRHVLWGYCRTPAYSDADMTDAIESQIERFAPGFRDTIVARSTMSAREMEAYNPNYVGGDINGGLQDVRQHFARPVARWSPYTTPAPNVFLCSSSTPPGGGVHGMCGYNAARVAARRVLRGKE